LQNIFYLQEAILGDFHGSFALGSNGEVKKEAEQFHELSRPLINSTELQFFSSSEGQQHHHNNDEDSDDVHLMFSSDFIKGGPSLFNPQNSFDKEEAPVVTPLDTSSRSDEMILGTMEEDIIYATTASMGSVQPEDGGGRNMGGTAFSSDGVEAVGDQAGKGFQAPRRPCGGQRTTGSEDCLEQDLNQLLYSPPQSEAGSEAGGLFDVTTLLSADMKTPEGSMSRMPGSSSSHQPLMAEREVRNGGRERTSEAGRLMAPPYPDWQLTPPPEGHQPFIKEELNW